MTSISIALLYLTLVKIIRSQVSHSPHIVFILADDLGWNDVGFHGLDQIPTPNIDALAYSGIILNHYYTMPLCTPSRGAILTGKHPIHTGMQHNILYGLQTTGLPLSEKLLPQYLQDIGYRTHMVGKWHLGFYTKEYTPTYRGFDSHLGYWTGHQDYFDHTAEEKGTWGLDMRRNMDIAWDLHGKYSTDVFTSASVNIIKNHNQAKPLFLYLSHAAVHSANSYSPLLSPDDAQIQFRHIQDFRRSKFAGILHKLDESVGKVVEALQSSNMLNNSILVFCSDNGGAASGFNLNAASNWPLRGVKNTLWEGGVRGAALIWSPLLKTRGVISNNSLHATDWLPTLLSAANYKNISSLQIDGVDSWTSLSENISNNRTTILHNIDDIWEIAAITSGDWKLIQGHTYNGSWDGWYGASGRHEDDHTIPYYDINLVINSMAGKAVRSLGFQLNITSIKEIREKAKITCSICSPEVQCFPKIAPCLFNIKTDPCERNNLASRYPEVLQQLQALLKDFNQTAIEPIDRRLDERGDPKYFNNVWTNFGDFIDRPFSNIIRAR